MSNVKINNKANQKNRNEGKDLELKIRTLDKNIEISRSEIVSKLFGTDGVRGIANVELTASLAFDLGRVGAYVITKNKKENTKILIGGDSRISYDMLESAISAGMMSVGVDVYVVGTIPTPAMAYLVRKYKMDAGVMISASHNKMQDNGIKFFNQDGYKLSDEIENEIEDIIKNKLDELPQPTGAGVGKKFAFETGSQDYIAYLTSISENRFEGLKIAIDCANGATSFVAKTIFENLGAEVLTINNSPNGININRHCGSTHLDVISNFVKSNKVDVGFAFDGDGDRCLAVDEKGEELDGDQLLAIIAKKLKENGKLKDNTIVATLMSNLGLTIYGQDNGIDIVQTAVGDRYVLEYMLEHGKNLGGEQSGHVIMLDYNTTGDGILTAILLLNVLKTSDVPVSELAKVMKKLPQALVNANVHNKLKYDYLKYDEIKTEIERLEAMFAGRGRVLIRPSGTEALVRVMIEGEDINVLNAEARKLADLIEEYLS